MLSSKLESEALLVERLVNLLAVLVPSCLSSVVF